MSITRADVADLRPGDVVELTRAGWPEGSVVRGPLSEQTVSHRTYGSGYLDTGKTLSVCGTVVRWGDGSPGLRDATLTVVSRAARLYVNHDRAVPVPGDVVRQESGPEHSSAHTWHYLGDGSEGAGRWYRFDDTRIPFDEGAPLRLLVDGTTGQVVP